MMSRLTSWIVGWLAALVMAAPLLALGVAAVVDLGPDGQVRGSLFPLVLSFYDPMLRSSLGHSLAMAAAIAIGSGILGLGLGILLARRPFWGRPVFRAMLGGLASVPPAFLALGALGLADALHESAPAWLGPTAGSSRFPFGWRWLVWFWIGLIPGASQVLDATVRGLEAPDQSRIEAARLAGAGRFRIALGLVRPRLQPALLAVVRGLFVQTLADPGPALVLGLRRTLGFQIVAGAIGPDPFARTAAAGLIVLAVTFVAWALLRRATSSSRATVPTNPARTDRAALLSGPSTSGVAMRWLLLPAWIGAGWLPIFGLARLALEAGPTVSVGGDPVASTMAGSWAGRAAIQSLALALALAATMIVLTRCLPWSWPGFHPGRVRRLARWLGEVVPPLVTGVGVLALGWLGLVLTSWWGAASGGAHTQGLAPQALGPFDPRGMPGLLVFAGVFLARLTHPLDTAARGGVDPEPRRRRLDQARLLGIGRGRALALAQAGGRIVPLRVVWLWCVLAAVGVSPAIVLAGPGARWGVGPAVVTLSSGPGESRRQAAILAMVGIAACLGATALARGSRRMSN